VPCHDIVGHSGDCVRRDANVHHPHCEFISYSEWDWEAAIGAYRNGDAHEEIVRHTRGLKGAKAQVRLYELVK
jgi:heme-degrading monooxygenase HmoA